MSKRPKQDFAIFFNPCDDPKCGKLHVDVFHQSGVPMGDDPKEIEAALRFAADAVREQGLPGRRRAH